MIHHGITGEIARQRQADLVNTAANRAWRREAALGGTTSAAQPGSGQRVLGRLRLRTA
jgi:hypothetical protein